ncbi:MAG: hypothetical protein ACP5PS_02870 [Bacteroidales bacterium]
MLLRFARSTQPYVLVIVMLAVGVMWFTVPIRGDYCNVPAISIYRWLYDLSKSTGLLIRLTGLVSLLLMASLVIQLNTKYLFIGQRSYLPGILFLLLSLLIHHSQNFHPVLWAGILLLFAIDRLLGTYRYDSLSYRVFDAAFFIGLSAVFYPPLFFLLLFCLLILPILRPFYWREWLLVLLGMALPFYFTFALLYLLDKPESSHFFLEYINLLTFRCEGLKNTTTGSLVVFYYVIFILLLSVFSLLRNMGSIKILARKSYYLFFLLIIHLLLLYGLVPQVGREIFILMAIPVSYVIAFYFQTGRHSRFKLILFNLLVLTIILIRYVYPL